MHQLSIILVLWAGITACVQAAEPVTLGLNYPRTGPYKEEGLAQRRGALLAIDELNAKGGVLGRSLRLSSEDSASRPHKAERNVDKLATEGAVMLFGGISGDVTIAAGKRAKEYDLLYFAVAHANDITGKDGHRHLFRETDNAWMSAQVLGRYLNKNLPNKRYFYVTADYNWGHTTEASLRQITATYNTAQHAGARVPFNGRQAEYLDALNQAKASNADMLVLVLFGEDLVRAMRIAQDLDLTKRMQIIVPNLTLNMVEQAGPNLMQGVIGTSPWTWRVAALEKSARGEAFIKSFRARYDIYPSDSAASAYSIVYQWADAAKRAGSFNSEALIKALEGYSYTLLKDKQQWRTFDHQNLQTVYAVRVKPREEVLKSPLEQLDYFEIIDRLDASNALPSLEQWKDERRAAGQPLTLQ